MKKQTCVPFVLLTHIRHRQQCNKYWKHCCGSTAIHSPYCWTTYVAADNMKHA